MATKLYFRGLTAGYATNNDDADLRGNASPWSSAALSTTAGAAGTTDLCNTVNGPTAGVEIAPGPRVWYSPPLDADVTISGSITWNLWAWESSMSANAAINGILEVIDGATGAITLIDKTARVAELGTGTAAANFSETPASGVACKRGDRLRVRVFADDAGTMSSGFNVRFSYDGAVGGQFESWVQLNENLSFAAEPSGSQVFLTDTASDVSTASVDRKAWTARGSGVVSDVTNTAAGWVSPIQLTDTAGGTVVDWFTEALAAFTLGGAVRCNIRALESVDTASASLRAQIAVVDADGTNPVVWAEGGLDLELPTTQTAMSFLISGDDLSVAAGKRLRIRLFVDDSTQFGPLATGNTVTVFYAGTSGGASGDTYLTFSQTLSASGPVTGSFTANAVLRKTQSASFTMDAYLVIRTTGSFTANAVLFQSGVHTFEVDAIIERTIETPIVRSADDFIDTVGTALVSHAPSIGTDWTGHPDTGVEIKSGDAIGGDTVSGGHYKLNPAGDADGEWEAVLNVGSDADMNGFVEIGVVLRAASDLIQSISATIYRNFGGSVQLARITGFGVGTIVQVDTEILQNTDYKLTVKANGPNYDLYKNDVLLGSGSSATYMTNVEKGVVFAGPNSASQRIKKFKVSKNQNVKIDAVLKRTQNATRTIDAVLKDEQTASFTMDAFVLGSTGATFTADAIVRREQSASAVVDAIVQRTQSASATVDAVVEREIGASLTADAVLQATMVGTYVVDAVVRREQTASWTADAVIRSVVSAALTVDAVLFRAQLGSLTADAVMKREQIASLTLDALVVETVTAGALVDAIVRREQTASLTADAVLKAGQSASFSVDALVQETAEASITADAVVLRAMVGSLTVDAVVRREQSTGLTVDAVVLTVAAATLSVDAVVKTTTEVAFQLDSITRVERAAGFTVDASIIAERLAQLTVDAVVKREQSGGFTVGAFIEGTGTFAFSVDAVLKGEQTAGFTADALIYRTVDGSFVTEAIVKRTASATVTADAALRASIAGSATADAVIRKTVSVALTADAVILQTRMAGFDVDSVFLSPRTASLTVDAVVLRAAQGVLTADATVQRTQSATFGADAVIRTAVDQSFTVDAEIIVGSGSGSFTANAVISRTTSQALTIDAVIRVERSGSLVADALLRAIRDGSLTADAVLQKTVSHSFDSDAVLRAPRSETFTIEAVFGRTSSAVFTVDASLVGSGAQSFTVDAIIGSFSGGSFSINAVVAVAGFPPVHSEIGASHVWSAIGIGVAIGHHTSRTGPSSLIGAAHARSSISRGS